MPITFIFGKPGGGKSLGAIREVCRELRTTNRAIVTNLPLHPGRINEWLQERFPGLDCGAIQRIRIISDEEVRQFWRFRVGKDGKAIDLPEPDPKDREGRTDFTGSQPALFILDEVHIQFGARNWQATGPGALYYLSQHRKLGDDVILISQALHQVDKQLRMLSQDFIHHRNLGKESYKWFKLPDRILWSSYLTPPTPQDRPVLTGQFGILDDGYCNLYDTTAGTGIAATNSQEQDKRKGFRWYWVAIPVLLAMVLLYYSDRIFALSIGTALKHVFMGQVDQMKGKTPHPVAPSQPAPSLLPNPKGPTFKPVPERENIPAESVEAVAVAKVGKTWTVYLADGRTFRSPVVEAVTPSHVIIAGKVFPVAKQIQSAPAAAASPVNNL